MPTVGIMARGPNWFPANDMAKAVEIIRNKTDRWPVRVGYGSSMGGYGCLKYMNLLGLTHSIAFAPQYSINPTDVGAFDGRFHRHFVPSLHSTNRIETGDVTGDAYLFFDPLYNIDRIHADHLAALSTSVQKIKVFLSWHYTIEMFSGSEKFSQIADSCIDGDTTRLQFLANSFRRDRRLRVRAAAGMIASRKPKLARAMYTRYSELFSNGERALFEHNMACLEIARGNLPHAKELLAAAISLYPERALFHRRMSDVYRRLGDFETAIYMARNAIALDPRDDNSFNQLAEIYKARGDLRSAAEAWEKASELAPSNPAYKRLLDDCVSGLRNDNVNSGAAVDR